MSQISKVNAPSILSRRGFLGGASSTLLCAPAIVKPTSLMRLRGIILPREYIHYGSVTRMWLFATVPSIRRHQAAGLSAHEIASYYNAREIGYANGNPWDADGVLGIIRLDEAIRGQDAILRAERSLLGS